MVRFYQREYLNFGRCLIMENDFAQLMITLDVGPRIVSYKLTGGENVLFNDENRVMTFESDELQAEGGELGRWVMYGGHRFWTAPEDYFVTYDPDNRPYDAQLDEAAGCATLTAPKREATGFRKTLKVTLAHDSARVTVEHILANESDETKKVALWGVTAVAAGNVEIVPLPVNETPDFIPRQLIALWFGMAMDDPRVEWKRDCAILRQSDKYENTYKFGTCVEDGWIGCVVNNSLLTIKVPFDPEKNYPDRGCNYETFTNTLLTELETLGELAPLAPGEKRSHTEVWNLVPFEKLPDVDERYTVETLGRLAHELLD